MATLKKVNIKVNWVYVYKMVTISLYILICPGEPLRLWISFHGKPKTHIIWHCHIHTKRPKS